MPRIGVSITKSCAFRNSTQEFSNVYYYEVVTTPSVAEANQIIDNIVTKEKTLHSTLVTFKKGRVWTQIGTPSQNEMITQKNLSGTGSGATVTSMDKERAFLVRLRAGNDSRGNPVYLRKWYHSIGQIFVGINLNSSILDNSTGISASDQTSIEASMNWIGDANGSPLAPKLCSKTGRLPDVGATWKSHQFLEHHQLGDQWRAQ